MRLFALVAIILLVLPSTPLLMAQEECRQARPLVIVYCQDQPEYGERLAEMLDEDPRIDAEFLVLSDPELFIQMIYFPHVKVAVIVLNSHENEGLGDHLENFFDAGGGLVGMGFAGWAAATGNASRTVFPLNATSYVAGKYDREKRAFSHDLYLEQEHEVSEGIGNFTPCTQKFIFSFDRKSAALIPPNPSGKLTVIYRDLVKNSPSVVAYEEGGVSVTLGGFAGDSIEGTPTHYSLFTEQDEFKRLFTNSVHWVWSNEDRYESTLSAACEQFAAENADREDVLDDAKRAMRRRDSNQMIRWILTVVLMTLGIGAVHRICLTRPKLQDREGKDATTRPE